LKLASVIVVRVAALYEDDEWRCEGWVCVNGKIDAIYCKFKPKRDSNGRSIINLMTIRLVYTACD
jgi:hypothetical protein